MSNRGECRTIFTVLLILPLLLTTCNTSRLTPELSESVLKAAKISTVEHVYRDIIFVKEQKRFLGIPVSRKEVLFSVDIRIKAGVRLDERFVEQARGKSVVLKLPVAEILSVDADEKSIQEYYHKHFGTRVSLFFYNEEIERQKEVLLDESLSRGIIEQAQNELENYLEMIYLRAGYREVRFIWGHPEGALLE